MVLDLRHTDTGLVVSSILIGIAVGLSIVVFHVVMLWFEAFFRFLFEETSAFPVIRFFALPLIGGFGGLAVGVLNASIFRDTDGDGLRTVVEAVHHRQGRLSGRLAVRSILNAALSISSGGGGGRESPTILLGSSLGSVIGQWMTLRPRQLRLLSASGAAAAIAGIFNAPLGGIVFAVEVIFGRVSLQTIIPVVLSSVMSTATARFFWGTNPILVKPASGTVEWVDYILLAIVGMLSGVGTVYFLRAFRRSQALVRRVLLGSSSIMKPALGGLLAGALVAIAPDLLETTYEPVNRAIRGEGLWWMAVVTLLLKPISAAITIGSGGEGGTFAPAVKFGALLGLCFGTVIGLALPESQPGLYALVCAASVLAGSYYAPLTGALVLFEISGNYELLLPLMFSAMFSVFIVNKVGIHTFNPNQRSLDVEPLSQHQP